MKLSSNTVTPLHHQSDLLFVVIGAQRTGTNILREILNSNQQIAMLGEVLAASPAHRSLGQLLPQPPSYQRPRNHIQRDRIAA